MKNTLIIGQKFKSYAAWDVEQEGQFDIMEVVELEGELAYQSQKDGSCYALNFIGSENLIPVQ